MLSGEFRHSIDQKNRVFLPAKLREELGDTLMITRDIREKCLKVFSIEGWQAYIAPIKQQERAIWEPTLRVLNSMGTQAEPDAQGRVLLPARLVKYAEIEKNAVIVGCGDYAEIWAEGNYDRMVEDIDFDKLRQALEACGL